ncbi:MAG: zinc metalloprotease HtpX [Deltaproteobacteria bacterium]|nr:zinc metalloprotease HtpX [Deltaproteobacteria bacterium]MCL4874431.1 zinc metalloprotease HtpX [bacterium]
MSYLKTFALLAVLTALLIFLGDMLGGRQGAVSALIFAGAMNFGAYWWSDRIVLRMYSARRVDEGSAPGLYGMVAELAGRAKMPMPAVYVIENDTPNAFATGRNPGHAAVAVTTGIMGILEREELEGVIAHELSHVRHRDILISSIAATIAGAIILLARLAYFSAIFGGRRGRDGNPLALLVMMIVAPVAAMIVRLAVSRSREYGADDGGAVLTNPLYLASALRKLEYQNRRHPMQVNDATAHLFIVNPLSGQTLARLFSTHPPIAERVRRLEGKAAGM